MNNIQKYFAVIDTETNWSDSVMSIGVVIAEKATFKAVDKKYYIITPECNSGGMYSSVLDLKNVKVSLKEKRKNVMSDLINTLESYDIDSIFAYNANFDCKHMKELNKYKWFDIMRLAAYKQYNKAIPEDAQCCKTGRLKSGFGVEPVMNMLLGSQDYKEVHNALCDAVDELKIMKLLGHKIEKYDIALIK